MDSTYVYVSDNSTHRVNRYNAASGTFAGWIGYIASTGPTMTGPGTCSSVSAGGFTPGWCSGGTSGSNATANGSLNYPNGIAGDGTNLYVADSANARIEKYAVSSGAYVGWIGQNGATPAPSGPSGSGSCPGAAAYTALTGWCVGGTSTSGTGNGAFGWPEGLYVDGTGNLYVADQGLFRISRFNASTGASKGWIGGIGISPTANVTGSGVTTCVGATSATPGWCSGGTSANGYGDGQLSNPTNMVADSTYLYVLDSLNGRISRYGLASGTFAGWIGGNRPSTSSWSVAPNPPSVTGRGDGEFWADAQGLYLDRGSGALYVAAGFLSQVSKFDSVSGVFSGWFGLISTPPTGGDAGCSTATFGVTPGFCVGGQPNPDGQGDGGLDRVYAVTKDPSGNYYVADGGVASVKKYSASGTFVGWIGNIGSTAPSGPSGAGSCGVTTPGHFDGGWCVGGYSVGGAGDGMLNLNSNSGVYADSSGSLYVVDQSNNRINKYNASTGAFVGWIGNVMSTTTPTAISCGGGSASNGHATPGWCTGGSSQARSSNDGSLSSPSRVTGDGTYLYVTDTTNNRVNKYVASTGAFVGWIGEVSSTNTIACQSGTPAVGLGTPSWCTGGTNGTGAGDAMLDAPMGITLDPTNTYLYVADQVNSRVAKYVAATGAFVGWIGAIGVSPTGGDPGCAGAQAGTVTPGWCRGGSAQFGFGNGMFDWTYDVAVDGLNDYLYILSGDNRITRWAPP